MDKIVNDLRETATATCSNAYLMDNGTIVTSREYKQLKFIQWLSVAVYYDYANNRIVRI